MGKLGHYRERKIQSSRGGRRANLFCCLQSYLKFAPAAFPELY